MNKRFMKNICMDVFVLWPALYFAVLGTGKAQFMGENIVGFLGVFSLVCAIIILCVSKDLVKKSAESDKYQPATKLNMIYGAVTTVVEVLVIASMGWYFSAVGFFFMWLVSSQFHDDVKKAREEKVMA